MTAEGTVPDAAGPGDPSGVEEGEEALRSGTAVLPRPARATAEATGSQTLDYLHRMLTQDLRAMRPFEARPALVLTREGRVLADPLVVSTGDRVLLDWDPRAAAAALPVLERFVIADDVAFADRTGDVARVVVAGPGAGEALARATGLDPPGALAASRATLAGAEVLVVRRDLGHVPAFALFVPRAAYPEASAALLALPGAVLAGEAAWDAVRVDEGVPAFGAEIDDRVLANEAGLESSISWTKGCFVGQEPVVMARHRGHPPSLLCRLSVASGAPARGTALLSAGRRVGRLTTVVPRARGARALGYVSHALARAGERLALEEIAAEALVEAVLAR